MKPKRKRAVRIVLGVLAVLFAWAAWKWFPISKEPGYRFELSWGETGSGPGDLEAPIGIVIHRNEVFVSDSGNNRIQVFNRQGKYLRSFGREGEGMGELNRPMHMGIHDGKLYVAEYMNDRIQVFSMGGESISIIGSPGSGPGEFDAPAGVVFDS